MQAAFRLRGSTYKTTANSSEDNTRKMSSKHEEFIPFSFLKAVIILRTEGLKGEKALVLYKYDHNKRVQWL